MKATIEVKDRNEAEAIRTGLIDPSMRACVLILGALNALSPRQRERVMSYVVDRLDEENVEAAESVVGKGDKL